MSSLPDSPAIVDAEQNGYPVADPVICPECGEECETVYVDRHGDRLTVFGCDRCLKSMDAYDWAFERKKLETGRDGVDW